MRRTFNLLMLTASMLLTSTFTACATDQRITVNANSTEISEGLDLRAVANLFADSKNLEAFERTLNDPKESYTNLDLNGDGHVDYIRVIETLRNGKHIIVLQAVLAQDIYQDVATIIVEGDSNSASIRVEGDVRIYGANYVIEPVFYYRPVIYDWFWGPYWAPWGSPYYWGYYPHWWTPYAPCPRVVYIDRCCDRCTRSHSTFRASERARVVRTNGAGRVDGVRVPSSGRSPQTATTRPTTTTATRPATTTATRPTSTTATRPATTTATRPATTTTAASRPVTTTATTTRPVTTTATTTRPTSTTATTTRPTSTTATTTRPTSTTATRPASTSMVSAPRVSNTSTMRPASTSHSAPATMTTRGGGGTYSGGGSGRR